MSREERAALIAVDRMHVQSRTPPVATEPPLCMTRCMLSEALGTFVLILFGCGSVAQSVLSEDAYGGFLSINISWGIGVMIGICVSRRSGSHINPAVTLAMAFHGRLPWRRVPGYMAAQIVGAFLAAAVVYGTYSEAINHFDGGERKVTGPKATAQIFATYPAAFLSTGGGVVDQIVGTALLVLGVFAVADSPGAAAIRQLLIGLLVVGIGASFGLNTGYSLNPARDFGPRLFSSLVYGSEVFTAYHHFAWIPVLIPFVGGVFGSYLYALCIAAPQKPAVAVPPAAGTAGAGESRC